jgi:hypothetical protein
MKRRKMGEGSSSSAAAVAAAALVVAISNQVRLCAGLAFTLSIRGSPGYFFM